MYVAHPPRLYSVDYLFCDELAVLTPHAIISTFADVLARAGATVVDTVSHAFPGTGLTSVLILQESHAVIHTWPETGTVHVDIFSCSPRLRAREAVEHLRLYLGARDVSVQEIRRADGHQAVGHRALATP